MENVTKSPPGYGVRHLQITVLFLLFFITHAIKINLSVAIIAIVNSADNSTSSVSAAKDFHSNQSLILSSFLWGYVIALLPAGPLAERYGPKIVLLIGIGMCSILTILTPLVAHNLGWISLCCLRALQGFTQGGLLPCAHTLLSSWAPTAERGRLATISYAGGLLGLVVMSAVSGIIIESAMAWEGIFYVSGAVGVIATVLWSIYGANTPSNCKWITIEEKEYIMATTNTTANTRILKIPWLAIMTSPPLIGLLLAHAAQIWGFWIFITCIPSYMNDILEFDLRSNAMLSSLPFLAIWLMSFVFCISAEFLQNRKYLTPEMSRKVFNSIGLWIPALILIALGYATKERKYSAVVLFTTAAGLNAATFVGYLINHMDLSPNFAGTLMGVTTFFSNLISIFAPISVGTALSLTNDPVTGWRAVFFISAGVYFFGNLAFVIFGKAAVQPWNNIEETKVSNRNRSLDLK